MTPVSYLISVTTSQKHVGVIAGMHDIAGKAYAIVSHREGDSSVGTDLWVIPQSKKSRQELKIELEVLKDIRSVSVVPLSEPIKESELVEVRDLFAALGWDTSEISDEVLSLFINAKLKNEYTYYIDFDKRKKARDPEKIRIRLLQEHPDFTPDWIEKTDQIEDDAQDRELSSVEIEITRTEIVRHTVTMEIPPPPPPPPHSLRYMTDEQIRDWVRNEKGFHRLKDGIIEIKRTSEVILITMTLGDETETVGYRLTK